MKTLYFILMVSLASMLTSCYPMPSEDCVSTIPMTNNPQVVPQKGSWMPSASY